MNLLITAITILLLTATIESLKPLEQKPTQNNDEIDKILQFLDNLSSRRAVDQSKLSLAKQLYKRLKKSHLRENPNETNNDQAVQAETELKSTLKATKAAVEERPFVEKKGKNDFLVMGTNNGDKFVTIIPNNIYYNIEKRCVNWLDDCSLKGIRQKLLRGVQSP